MRPRVALATYEQAPHLAPDDQLLVPALDACGISAHAAIWSNDAVPWASFDAVVIRSCWDYHLHIAAFRAWLDRLESLGVRVLNPPSLVRWNAEKRYLLDLAQRGIATIPTLIVPAGRAQDVESLAAAEGWSRFVIKPAVSASGYETYALQIPLDAPGRESVRRATSVGDALLQPFAPEVSRDGEFSFTFIDGLFSHATLKRAAAGEFRVQTEHGGSAEPVAAPAQLIDQAARVLTVLPERPLYARVDGISRDGSFLLMELELIEPHLFLSYSSGAAAKLARAIQRAMTL
jgi:glutathione synthase/RimK-type ligase-like ATP-grasp enzyme